MKLKELRGTDKKRAREFPYPIDNEALENNWRDRGEGDNEGRRGGLGVKLERVKLN